MAARQGTGAPRGRRARASATAPRLPKSAPVFEPAPKAATPSDLGRDGGRVAKALARAGVASRREVERLIEAGRVALNGKVLTTPAVKVEPGDILTVDGAVIADAEPTRLFRYHKPVGLVTTHVDTKGRPTVFEALPKDLPRVISIGRLDLASEGLLLLTNDGALSRALELPSSGWMRRYRARAYGQTTQEKLDTLKAGITVEGVKYGSIEAKLDKAKDAPGGGRNIWITLTLGEGKNREVRRVLEALGLKVNRLIRLSYGPFALGTLEAGHVEEVGPRVIRELLEGVVAPANMPTGEAVQFKMQVEAGAGRRAATPPRHATDLGGPRQKAAKAGPTRRGDAKTGEAQGAETRTEGRGRERPFPAKSASKPAKAGTRGNTRASGGEVEAKKVYKAGWAKPKIKASGSGHPAGPRAAGAPGRKDPAAGPRKTGSRPPGPRPGGGPKRPG